MLSIARSVLSTARLFCPSVHTIKAQFHSVVTQRFPHMPQNSLLNPTNTPSLVPSCGFKVMGKVRKRCKDCYMVRRQERLYVICKTHPRHKQMSMVKDPKNTWILTHATQGKKRPW